MCASLTTRSYAHNVNVYNFALTSKKVVCFSLTEIEKFCWMAAHEHKHGVLPSEYDIREIDEDLYLQLLQKFKAK